jgi:hypothetical protein
MENPLDKHFLIIKIFSEETEMGQVQSPISLLDHIMPELAESLPLHYSIKVFDFENNLLLDSGILKNFDLIQKWLT